MLLVATTWGASPALAQVPTLPPPSEVIRPRPDPLPEAEPLPEEREEPFLPLPDQQPMPTVPDSQPAPSPGSDQSHRLTIREIRIVGNTAFTEAELLEQAVAPVIPWPIAPGESITITLADLDLAVAAITQYYVDNGYPTTGAIPFPREILLQGVPLGQLTPEQIAALVAPDGVVTFDVVEGSLEAIEVLGTTRLRPEYVRSRLGLAAGTPLNVVQLVEALQLLYNDPLIDNVQAALLPASFGTNILQITIWEADSFQAGVNFDNSRSPNVGRAQRGVQFSEGNLLGFGDRLTLGYSGTSGSDGVSFGYTLPVSPRQGTVSLSYNHTKSQIIEPTVAILGIESTSDYWELTWREPLIRTPYQEFALGLTWSSRQNRTVFGRELFGFEVGFPVGDGRSQSSAIRFAQDWLIRDAQQAFAVRSQFSLGLSAMEPGIDGPLTSQFFSWRGQAQYRRQLGENLFLLARGDVQLADRGLVPLEQFSLGGAGTVRGYRQGLLLADGGALGSVELWIPVARAPEINGLLQLVPFVDVGRVWNSDEEVISAASLASVGLGLRWQQDYLSAQFDLGIPLIARQGDRNTWAANGLHFSISITGF